MIRMRRIFQFGKAQSVAEYALAVTLVALAVSAMSVCLKRSVQGKIAQGADTLALRGLQYEAGKTTSHIERTIASTTIEDTATSGEQAMTLNETVTATGTSSTNPFN